MAIPQIPLYPSINGHRYSYQSLEISVNGLAFFGITEITYSSNLAPADVRGTSSSKLGRTRGIKDAKCSLTMYKSEYENLRASLGGVAGSGYGEKSFRIVATYFEQGHVPIVDLIEDCRITDDEDMPGSSDSAEPAKVKLTLNVMDVLRGGTDSIGVAFGIV